MDRQVTIKPEGNLFHVKFHNYMGPFEGHRIGRWLGLEEVDPPSPDGDGSDGDLSEDQYYMWHALDRHPDLHALVSSRKMQRLAQATEHFHVRVVDGEELVPELPEELKEHHSDESYIEYIEREHQSAFDKGPKAVLGAFLFRAAPVVVLALVALIASRHFGDHRQDVTVQAAFARAQKPAVSQSSLQGFFNPDYSHLLRAKLQAVCAVEDNRFMTKDGSYIAVEGMDDVMPVLRYAQEVYSAPLIEMSVVDGQLQVDQIVVGDRLFAQGTRLVQVASLKPTQETPYRGRSDKPGMFLKVDWPPEGGAETLLGKRVSLEGKLEPRTEDGRFVLRMSDGNGVALSVAAGFAPMIEAMGAFAERGETVEVDLAWQTSEGDASSSLVGEGVAYSLSNQNYHLIAKR